MSKRKIAHGQMAIDHKQCTFTKNIALTNSQCLRSNLLVFTQWSANMNCIWTLIIGRHQGWYAGDCVRVEVGVSFCVDCNITMEDAFWFGFVDFLLDFVSCYSFWELRELKLQTSWHQLIVSPDKPCARWKCLDDWMRCTIFGQFGSYSATLGGL